MNYYKCSVCGNVVKMVKDSGIIPVCCGKEMNLLHPSKLDEAHSILVNEKDTFHDVKTVRVCIGKTDLHPMSIDHYIEFIGLITDKGTHTYFFDPGNKPCAKFFIRKHERILTIYAFCNIHGLYQMDYDEG